MAETGFTFNCIEFTPPDEARLRSILDRITGARVLVVGDLCLDVYWFVDPSRSERSLETGLPTHPVREQRYSPGGAGNVANNLVAAGCRDVRILGVVGEDPWGHELGRLLRALGIKSDDVLVQDAAWATPAYTKPHFDNHESNRFDFGNFNELSSITAAKLLSHCRACIPEADVVIINEQVQQGIHSREFRDGLADLIREFRDTTFIVDGRHFSASYVGAHLKINDDEAVRLCGTDRPNEEVVSEDEVFPAATELFARFGKPVFVTRGNQGMVVVDRLGFWELPVIRAHGPVDTVGAGDSTLAGIALALAAGCDAAEAGHLGNLFAGVTIQKLNQTGTATPEEILAFSRRQ